MKKFQHHRPTLPQKQNHEYSLSILYICLKNMCIVGLFIFFAMYFKLWWLVFGGLIFQSGFSSVSAHVFTTEDSSKEISNIIRCYFCGEMLFVENIEDAVHTDMKSKNWTRAQFAGSWVNLCPHCSERYLKQKKSDTDK